MADSKKVKVFDGTNWVSIEPEEATLPISSVDETVTLASLAQKSFSIQVGDKGNLSSQLTVDSVAVRIKQGTNVSTIIVTANAEEPNSWLRFNGSGAAGFFGYEQATEKFRILNDASTGSAFEFETNTGNLNVAGQVQTDTITTEDAADGDALVNLSQRVFVQVAGAKLYEDTGMYDRQGTFTIQNYYENGTPVDDDTVLTLSNRSNYYGARIDFANGNSTLSDTGGAVVRASIEKGSINGQNPNDPDDIRDGHMHYRVYGLTGYNPHHVFHVGGENAENIEALRLAWNEVTVSTGGEERLRIDDDATVVNNRLLVGSPSIKAEMALFHIDSSQWSINQPHIYGLGHAVMETINFQQNTENTYAGYSMSAFNSTGTEQSAFIGVISRDTENNSAILGGEVVITARNDGGIQQQLLRLNNEAVTFYAELHVDKIVGTAYSTDASIELGTNLSFISAGIFNFQFENADGTQGSKINVGYNETSGTGFANVGVGGCYLYLRDSKRLGIGATGINFNANAASNAGTYDWTMETDGTFVANAERGIEASYITAGRNNAGGSLATSPKVEFTGVSVVLQNVDGSTFEPTEDDSLVTKKWVLDNSSAGFPIESSTTGTVKILADDLTGSLVLQSNAFYSNNIDQYGNTIDYMATAFRIGTDDASFSLMGLGYLDVSSAPNDNEVNGVRVEEFLPHTTSNNRFQYIFHGNNNPLSQNTGEGWSSENDPLGQDPSSRRSDEYNKALIISHDDIKAHEDYEPQGDSSLITRSYLEDYIRAELPDSPLPPIGIGAGYTWTQLTKTPGLYLSAIHGINGIFSLVGYSQRQMTGGAGNAGLHTPACYYSIDGGTWVEGFVGDGDWSVAATMSNKYGRVCDGSQTLFTGNAYTTTGRSWQGFGTDGRQSSYVGTGVPVLWNTGYVEDQAVDGTLDPGGETTNMPSGPTWLMVDNNRFTAIESLEAETLVYNAQAFLTFTDVDLTNNNLVSSPKYFYVADFGDGPVRPYLNRSQIFYPLADREELDKLSPSDVPTDMYGTDITDLNEFIDTCTQSDAKATLILAENTQFYWMVHKRTTLTVPTGLWGKQGLCCAYDSTRKLFATVTNDAVRVYTPPNNETYDRDVAYGGTLVHTYSIPQSVEWSSISISGGIYMLMSKDGLLARLDTNNESQDTFEVLTGSSPVVYSSNPTLAGANGRFLITGGADIQNVDNFGKDIVMGQASDSPSPAPDQKYAWSGGVNDPLSSINTAGVALTNPVDPNIYSSDGTGPNLMLTTQEDANQYFAEQIALNDQTAENASSTAIAAIGKATVNELSIQGNASGISQNEGAIAGNTVAIEKNSADIAKIEKVTPIVTLTQAEYDALADIDNETIYMITPV